MHIDWKDYEAKYIKFFWFSTIYVCFVLVKEY